MNILKNIRNYTILFIICWISVHLFYFIRYSQLKDYEFKKLIVYVFNQYIGYYTVTVFAIVILIILILIYHYSKMIISNAHKQAIEILDKTDIEINKIKRDLDRRAEKLESKKIRLQSNYKRKNMEKSVELEAIREKMKRLKNNQYHLRKIKSKKA